jgi:hypothetical protein
VTRAPEVYESALAEGATPRRAQERAEETLRRERLAARREANRRERALRWAESRTCDETLLAALKASVGEEMTVREKNETRVEARKGGIVVRADEEYVSIRDHSDRHGVWMVLSREEALFVRDQIDAALDAGMVRP